MISFSSPRFSCLSIMFYLHIAMACLALFSPATAVAEARTASPELLAALQRLPEDEEARRIVMRDDGQLGLAYAAYLALMEDGPEEKRRAIFEERIAKAAHALGDNAPYAARPLAEDAPLRDRLVWALCHIYAAHFETDSAVPVWILRRHVREAVEAGWGEHTYGYDRGAVGRVFPSDGWLLPKEAVPAYDALILLLQDMDVGFAQCTGTNYYYRLWTS